VPTKRQPLQRDQRARLTPELVELFQRLELTPQRLRRSSEYVAGEKRLCRVLGLDFWSMKTPLSVLTAESCYPPGHIQTQNWNEAWRWRKLLLAAAGMRQGQPAARRVRQ
jgi:hypothetical protein